MEKWRHNLNFAYNITSIKKCRNLMEFWLRETNGMGIIGHSYAMLHDLVLVSYRWVSLSAPRSGAAAHDVGVAVCAARAGAAVGRGRPIGGDGDLRRVERGPVAQGTGVLATGWRWAGTRVGRGCRGRWRRMGAFARHRRRGRSSRRRGGRGGGSHSWQISTQLTQTLS